MELSQVSLEPARAYFIGVAENDIVKDSQRGIAYM